MLFALILLSTFTNIKSTERTDIYRFELSDPVVNNGQYIFIRGGDGTYFHYKGKPAIPYYTYIIPAKGNLAAVKILNTEISTVTGKYLPLPEFGKKQMVKDYKKGKQAYSFNGFIPDKYFGLDSLNIRGIKYYRLFIFPARFNPFLNAIHIMKSLDIEFLWNKKQTQKPMDFLFKNLFGPAYTRYPQIKSPFSYKGSVFDSGLIWFKIFITKGGTFKITFSQLKEKGLYASFPSSMISLYSRGTDTMKHALSANDFHMRKIPLIVEDNNNNSIFDDGDDIIFYAEGPSTWKRSDTTFISFHNPYTDTTFYWLCFGEQGKTMPVLSYKTAPLKDQAYIFHHHEKDITNIAWKGLLWEGESVIRFQGEEEGKKDFSFNIENLYENTALLRIRLIGGESIQRNVIIESSNITDTFSPSGYFIAQRELYPITLHDGTNTFSVKIRKIASQTDQYGDQVYLDWYDIIYSVKTENLSDKEFFVRGTDSFNISLGTQDAYVFNINDPLSPYLLETQLNGTNYAIFDTTKELSRYYISSEPSTPQFTLEHDVGKLYSEDYSNTDMLIITSKMLAPSLWKYIAYRRYHFPVLKDSIWTKGEGNIKVVTTEDIFRDFGYGLHDPVSIRNFVYYVYENSISNGTPRLKFLLMVGDGTYDYRGIESNEGNIVPPFEPFETADINTYAEANETFYSDMNGDGFSDLFYGRVPVRTQSDVAAYFNKIINYERLQSPSFYRHRILLVADDERGPYGGDSEASWHVPQAEALYTSYTPKQAEKITVYETDFGSAQNPEERGRLAKSALIEAMNQGNLIMGFYGHSNPVQMTHEMLFTINDVNLINTHGKPPLCVILTCKFGAFARIEPAHVIAEAWVLNPYGVIGVIASPNATFAFSNGTTGRNIFGFSLDGKIHPLGEVSLSGHDPAYFLMGDPTVFFYYPNYDSTINLAAANDTIYTGELNTVSVTGNYIGEMLSSITGHTALKTYYTYPNNYALTYHTTTPILYRGELEKGNDSANIKFYLPTSADTGEIFLNTLRYDSGILRESTYDMYLKRGTPYSDIAGPSIKVSIDNKEIISNEIVNTPLNFNLTANLEDTHGINLQGIGEEKGIYLLINNNTYDLTPYFKYENNSYTEGKVKYTISLENEGEYDMSVVAYDNAGNRSQKTFRIYAQEEAQNVQNVLIYPNPLRGDRGVSVTFYLQKQAKVRLYIYSISGTMIYKTPYSFYSRGFNSIYWDGKDMFGDLPASGLYMIVLNIDSEGNRIKIKKGLFIERR